MQDDDRIEYLDGHLRAARRAIGHGVKLQGYFLWSLLDNFEWSLGYSRRFGITHVDFATRATATFLGVSPSADRQVHRPARRRLQPHERLSPDSTQALAYT